MTTRIQGRQLQRIRRRVLSANPLCAVCKQIGRDAVATEVDHIVPLCKGGTDDPADDSNRQGLCAECHAIKTADDLEYTLRMGGDEHGFPLDPNHPWNREVAK